MAERLKLEDRLGLTLASVINQTNYYDEGISLEELGIATLSKEELIKVLREGF